MAPEAVGKIAPDQLLAAVAGKMGGGAAPQDAIRLLWDTYHPWVVWVVLGVVGLASVIGMMANYRAARAPASAPTPEPAVG